LSNSPIEFFVCFSREHEHINNISLTILAEYDSAFTADFHKHKGFNFPVFNVIYKNVSSSPLCYENVKRREISIIDSTMWISNVAIASGKPGQVCGGHNRRRSLGVGWKEIVKELLAEPLADPASSRLPALFVEREEVPEIVLGKQYQITAEPANGSTMPYPTSIVLKSLDEAIRPTGQVWVIGELLLVHHSYRFGLENAPVLIATVL
jgi:hypothetical protein